MGLPRTLTRPTFVLLALVQVGCALPGGRPVPPDCEFPEGVPLSFSGQTTLAELGIPAPGEERDPVYAWVTAAAITLPSAPRPHRVACAERQDGSIERSAYPGALLTQP